MVLSFTPLSFLKQLGIIISFVVEKMGCHQSSSAQTCMPLETNKNQQTIRVLTLNYCGVLKSPFQFYSGQYISLVQSLSKTFLKLLPKYVNLNQKGQYEWNFSQIDKKMGNRRLSPVYHLMAGIKQNEKDAKFASLIEFKKNWDLSYNQALQELKLTFDQKQKNEAFQFDLLVLHTLLANVYGNINELEDNLDNSPQDYCKKYQPLFQQCFLDQEKKCTQLLLKIHNSDFDILFLQQASDRLIENLSQINKFHVQVSSDNNTLIVINKNKFKSCKPASQLMSILTQDQRKKLNWNNHTSLAIADNYILLNCHLSSKAKVNEQNMKQMKQSLVNLKNKFLSYEIICGGDANNYVSSFDSSFHIFPQSQSKFTSLKKRSYLQVQFSKSEKVVKAAKDHIISTLGILKGEIMTVEGHIPTEQSFLPLNQHPYDHFLVKVDLIKKDSQ